MLVTVLKVVQKNRLDAKVRIFETIKEISTRKHKGCINIKINYKRERKLFI